VKVLDFGIAKLEGPQNTLKTATNVVMGTPTYMAPEQARGDAAAPAMDLYSLGVVGFELFTGRVPFLETATVKLLMAHQQQKPPVPSSLSPGLPTIVDDFLLKLLAKDPAQRYRSGNEVRAAVQQLRKVLGDTTASVTQPAMERPPGLSQVVAIGRAASRSPDDEGSRTQPAIQRAQGLSQVVAVAPVVSSHPTGSDEALVAPMRRSSPLWLVSAGLVVVIGVLISFLLKSPAPAPPEPVVDSVAVAPPAPVKPPPAEPVVVPTPVVAPAVVQAAPDAGFETVTSPPLRAAPRGVEPRKRALERRLAALTVRLDAAQARGESVGLATQQLSALKKGLKYSRDAARLDAIETATQRLEEENP
jgi:serine/threonine-protein kinase